MSGKGSLTKVVHQSKVFLFCCCCCFCAFGRSVCLDGATVLSDCCQCFAVFHPLASVASRLCLTRTLTRPCPVPWWSLCSSPSAAAPAVHKAEAVGRLRARPDDPLLSNCELNQLRCPPPMSVAASKLT